VLTGERGFQRQQIYERMGFFGGFANVIPVPGTISEESIDEG
jgi:hypothetical protein